MFNCHVLQFLNYKNMTNFEWVPIEPVVGSARPGSRWGHSCCVVNENLYLFGGFANSNYMNDLWVYSLSSSGWKEIVAFGDVPDPRSNATLSYDAVNHQLILFGGGGPNKQRFNSICILDLNTLIWVEFPPFENEPSPWERTYHSAEFKFPYLVVFGGEGVDDLGDLWVYNMETLSWKEIKFSANSIRPKPRRFHSSCIIENSMYIFGGCEGKYSCLNDLFKLDLSSLLETGNTNDLNWSQIKLNGEEICARWGQTSHYYNGQIYIFGGRGTDDLQDLFSINPYTGKTNKIKATLPPQPRRRHSGGFVGGCLVLFGGFDGNYFNDLFYINLYRNKSQKKMQKQFSPEYGNYDVYSFNKLKITVNLGLIGKYFENREDMFQFLDSINNFYLIEELKVCFQTLYNGHGAFPIQKVHKKMMKFVPTEAYPTKQQILEQLELQESYCYPRKILQNEGKAIELESYQLASYIKSIQQHWLNNEKVKLNNFEILKTNRDLISSQSQFFEILLSKKFRKEEIISIDLKSCTGMHMALIFAFLHSKFLVIPKFSSYQFLVEIAQLAEYFAIPALLRACEEELSARVTSINCKELSQISKCLGMENLFEHCSLLTLNELVIKNKNALLSQTEEKMLEEKTLKLYKEIQFDLAHQKADTKYAKYSKHVPPEEKSPFSNKQNFPSNGLPRKTSNHFQK